MRVWLTTSFNFRYNFCFPLPLLRHYQPNDSLPQKNTFCFPNTLHSSFLRCSWLPKITCIVWEHLRFLYTSRFPSLPPVLLHDSRSVTSPVSSRTITPPPLPPRLTSWCPPCYVTEALRQLPASRGTASSRVASPAACFGSRSESKECVADFTRVPAMSGGMGWGAGILVLTEPYDSPRVWCNREGSFMRVKWVPLHLSSPTFFV